MNIKCKDEKIRATYTSQYRNHILKRGQSTIGQFNINAKTGIRRPWQRERYTEEKINNLQGGEKTDERLFKRKRGDEKKQRKRVVKE